MQPDDMAEIRGPGEQEQPAPLRADSRGTMRELVDILLEHDRERTALAQEVTALQERVADLERLAHSDVLTGLLNRGGLDEAIRREEARARRFGSSVVVLLVDIDNLKMVNDRHGHRAGDEVIGAVATALRGSVRASDIVARLGGDEFVALLLGTDTTGARVVVERARRAAHSVQLAGGMFIPVDFSVGIASRDESGTLAAALEVADQRLLVEKQRDHS